MSNARWFVILVRGRADDLGLYLTYWAQASDVGSAIALAEGDASVIELAEGGGLCPSDIRAEAVDEVDVEDLPEEAVRVSPNLLVAEEMDTWALSKDDNDFWFPEGVIPCSGEEDADPDDIVECYALQGEERGHLTVDICVDRRRLSSTLLGILDLTQANMTVRVFLMDDAGEIEKGWVSPPRLRAADFVERHRKLLRHGLVYLHFHGGNVSASLTDHKTLLVTGPEDWIAGEVSGLLEEAQIAKSNRCRTLASGFRHHHYVPADIAPIGVSELGSLLEGLGFGEQALDE